MMPLEKAVDLLRNLPAADYEAATNYILELTSGRQVKLSRAQLLEDLAISRQQEKEGQHQSATEAFDEVMAEYGLVQS